MNKIEIQPKTDLVFSAKVVEQCKNCKRYNKKASCPPHIASWEHYKKLLPKYEHGILYYEKYKIDDDINWERLGKNSSEELAKVLLDKRLALINAGHYFTIAFGGGSCKQCGACSIPCHYPEKSLIPIEATGLNIVKMMARFGVKIKHPVNKHFYRVGGIFYD